MGTGKTSLALRFVKGQFHDFEVQFIRLSFISFFILTVSFDAIESAFNHDVQESTIGAAFFTQVLSLNEATIKFDIWDTAGQERYHSLAPMYYRGAAAAVVVYDITNAVLALIFLPLFVLLIALMEKNKY